MPISISSEVLGTLSVTIAETTGTLEVGVLATAPAVLSVELGTPGPAATIAVGTVTALAPDATPTVVNSGTNLAAVLDFGFPSGSTTQVRALVRNETGATLTKGTVVYINGGAGNKVTVTKAIATGDATSAQTFGIVITDITNNQNGYVCVLGLVENLNTSAYLEGQQLYLSPTTAGAWTTTKPSAPDHMVYIAIVERVHANQGTILVRIQNGYELEELHNVAIASVTNGDLLVYESATSLWKNKSVTTLGLATQAWVDAQGYLQAGALTGYLLASTAASTYYPLTNPSGYITSSALSGYLLASTAASTYQTLAGMSAYLTTASASSTYQTQAAMSAYLTSATAASTYQTQAAMSAYLTTASAASTYQPIGSYLTDAPSDGTTYGRKDGAWEAVVSSVTWGGITGTLSDQTDLQTALDGKYDASNPSGFISSAPPPSGDFMKANAIASLIYSQSSNSYGDICFGNVPKFISDLGTNWGIVDGSSTFYNCTGFSGSSYSLSGTAGSGPYTVRVNTTDSAFTI